MLEMIWSTSTGEDVLEKLGTREKGLKKEEVAKRQEKYGKNIIEEGEQASAIKIFLKQFQDNLIYLLIAAAVLSVGIGLLPGHQPEWMEAGIITVILLGNGIFGFVQDYRAEKSIQSLKSMSTPDATVMRNGEKKIIDSEQLVPGDIIFLEQGDEVPADARVLDSDSMASDEAALTGESQNVPKNPDKLGEEKPLADRNNMVFKDTHIVRGRGKAVVTETGMETEVGGIAEEIEDAEDRETPFQEEVDRMGSRIGKLVLGIIAIVAAVMSTLTGAGPLVVFLMAISLVVAAVPESLPPIVTLSLAMGSKRMLEKNALVRRLPVVETLGSVNAIVTDKTGTLTEGVMTVEKIFYNGKEFSVTGRGTETVGLFKHQGEEVAPEQVKEILNCGLQCNNSEKASEDSEKEFIGQPTEVALLISAMKAGMREKEERKRTVHFTSHRKRMTVITKNGKAYMKGAPSKVLERCDRILIDGEIRELTEEKRQEIHEKNQEFAGDALRVLGFAEKQVEDPGADEDEIESGMVFLGLQGMIDPPREQVKDAVEDCRTAGIDVIMATGDNINTARAIGKELGFNPENAVAGPEIEEMSDQELQERVENTEIFARVSPHHKVRVLEALKSNNKEVAMTGDGLNDAPALEDSDVGIAMGQRGTDVAKDSSDMILQDDNFVTIRDAIEEGRRIFDNIRKVVNYLLSTNSAEVMFVFIGTIIGGMFFHSYFTGSEAVVLTAVMILWVNFATDGPPSIAMASDKEIDGIMDRQPRGSDEPIIDKRILASTAFTGPVAALIMLPAFFMFVENMVLAQTVLFTSLTLFEIVMIYIVREGYDLGIRDNKYIQLGVLAAVAAHVLLLYTPLSTAFGVVALSWKHLGISAATVVVFTLVEIGFSKFLDRKFGMRTAE